MNKKVFLVGLNLYSIFLSLRIKSDFKNANVTILEGSSNFLRAYNHLKIGKYSIKYCTERPGKASRLLKREVLR